MHILSGNCPPVLPRRRAFLLAFLFLLCNHPPANAGNGDDSKVQFLPVTPQIETAAAKALQGCPPPPRDKTIGVINKNGVYTLTGDLFHNGTLYAIVDNGVDRDAGVILCEWREAAWKAVAAINLQTSWKFPADYREQQGRDSDEPTPFWIIDLQKCPILVIATYVEKEGQNYYAILFDSKCERIIDTVYSFQQHPVVRDDYLITGDASRVKSEWGATYFSRIQNDKFIELASWEESEPWHATYIADRPDDTSHSATSGTNHYAIVLDDSKAAHPADYVIFKKTGPDDAPELQAQDYKKYFAKLYFTPMDPKSLDADSADKELAYIFEKLTGLPEELYPSDDPEMLNGKIESEAKITIKGGRDAIRLFIPSTVMARVQHALR